MNSEFTSRLERIETELSRALPAAATADWAARLFSSLDGCVQARHFAPLLEPCARLVALGGKRWRPLLLVLCAELAADAKKAPPQAVQNAYALTPLVEFAHTASLIHDDIEDNADTRRGQAAVHVAFGADVAINAASWLYFVAPACIDALPLPADEKNAFHALYLLELRRLHLGQAMDIAWHRVPALLPAQEEYTAMVCNKTGTLSRLAVKAGILAGGGTADEVERAGKLAEDIGVGFQILDDVTNLTTGNPGKLRGDDIVEGKKSLPVLLHVQMRPQDAGRLAALLERARAEGIRSGAVEEAIALLDASGAIEAARARGSALVAQKSRELASLYGTGGEAPQRIERLFAVLQAPKA